jgi:hypothetical protein
MKHLRTFENYRNMGDFKISEEYNSINENNIFGHLYDDLLSNIESDYSDAGDDPKELLDFKIEELKELENNNNTITLYRLIFTENRNDINIENIGHHYVDSLEDLHEGMIDYLYHNAKKSNPILKEDDLFYIEAETNSSNINYHETIRTFSLHPWENEITIKEPKEVKIVDISKYYE